MAQLEYVVIPKGPRTQIIGFEGSDTMILAVFGPKTKLLGSLDP